MMRWWPAGRSRNHSLAVSADLRTGRRFRRSTSAAEPARRRRVARRVHAVACSASYGWQGERGTGSGGRGAGSTGGECPAAAPAEADRGPGRTARAGAGGVLRGAAGTGPRGVAARGEGGVVRRAVRRAVGCTVAADTDASHEGCGRFHAGQVRAPASPCGLVSHPSHGVHD